MRNLKINNDTKTDQALSSLIKRQDYLVVQANDLAKAFGYLSLTEHKLLDFATSFVTKDSKAEDTYECKILDVIHYFGWPANGTYYKRVAEIFRRLSHKDNLSLYVQDEDGESIILAHLFSHIKISKSGKIKFQFSQDATPYLIQLKENFYSFKLSQLSFIKSKYTLDMMKLWEANRNKKKNKHTSIISGTLREWETWFLGKDTHWTPARFKEKVLNIARDEIKRKLGAEVDIQKNTRGRKILGYKIMIYDKKGYD